MDQLVNEVVRSVMHGAIWALVWRQPAWLLVALLAGALAVRVWRR